MKSLDDSHKLQLYFEPQRFMSNVKEILSLYPEETLLINALAKPKRDINQFIQEISDLNLSQEELWLATVQLFTQSTSPSKPTIRYIDSDSKKIGIIESQPNFVIKEAKSWWNGDNERVLREAFGTLMMESREFKYLRTPSLVAIRRHGPYNIIIIVQTNVPGTALSDNFSKMGQLEAGSVEQDRAVKQFNKPSFAFGQGKGEIHSLDLNYQLVPSAENIDADVENLRGFFNRINNLRRQMNGREINSEAIELLIYLFQENPGYLGHILGYVHSSDFTWSEKYMTIGIVDMEAFCSNLNVSLKTLQQYISRVC